MKKIILLMAAVSLVGCASITKGTSQTIIFNIEPKGTTCVATRDGDGEIGSVSTSNNTLKVSKDKDDIVVKCSAPGYKQKVTRLVSKTEQLSLQVEATKSQARAPNSSTASLAIS